VHDLGSLYAECALRIARQVYLVVQDEAIATAAVHDAFAQAGSGWDEEPVTAPTEQQVRAQALRLATGPKAKLVLAYRRLRDRTSSDRGRHASAVHPGDDREDADDRLLGVLNRLPTVQATAVVLHHLAGLSADRVAFEMESTVGAAAARIQAAETALAAALRSVGAPAGPEDIGRELAGLAERAHLPLLPPTRVERLPERRNRRALGLTGGAAASVLLVLGVAAAVDRGDGASLTSTTSAVVDGSRRATAAAVVSPSAPPGATMRSAEAGPVMAHSSVHPRPSGTRWLPPARSSAPDVARVPLSGTDLGYVRDAFRHDGQVYVEFDRAQRHGGVITNASTRVRVIPVATNAFVEPGGRARTVAELLRLVVHGEGADVPMRLRYDNGEVESFEELR
jgi:RNA polymerase sigma-70 factor, ECF subfamily